MTVAPRDIYRVLSQDVTGQDEALRYVSVAIFKHVSEKPCGNIILIGNSGTGKTSIMRAIEGMFSTYPVFKKHRAVVRMNANSLANEEGRVITGRQLFRTLQDRAIQILGKNATSEQIKSLMEYSTVCIDEIDKIATKVGGKPNPVGVNVQQSLLTLMEDESIIFDTQLLVDNQYKPVQLEIDTTNMLFVCAGAFEELYDQVYARVTDEGKHDRLSQAVPDLDGGVDFKPVFRLFDHLTQEDMFHYGMLPQFLSRFDTTLVLNDLTPRDLEKIFSGSRDSLFQKSRQFFSNFHIDLKLTERAREIIGFQAAQQSRVGARALKDVYSRVIQPYEFDPFRTDAVKKVGGNRFELILTEEIVRKRLGLDPVGSPGRSDDELVQ